MKFGDSVLYVENGQEFEATVIRSRELDDHSGSNDEPLLDIGFFKQVIDPSKGSKDAPVYRDVFGTQAQGELVQFRNDVAHDSHAFDEDQQKKHGKIYPGGRWLEKELSTFTGRIDEGSDQS